MVSLLDCIDTTEITRTSGFCDVCISPEGISFAFPEAGDMIVFLPLVPRCTRLHYSDKHHRAGPEANLTAWSPVCSPVRWFFLTGGAGAEQGRLPASSSSWDSVLPPAILSAQVDTCVSTWCSSPYQRVSAGFLF